MNTTPAWTNDRLDDAAPSIETVRHDPIQHGNTAGEAPLGIPSQDPRPQSQVALPPDEAQREAKSAVTGGGVVAGVVSGGAIGTAIGGPIGAVIGATVGATAGALAGLAAGEAIVDADRETV